MTAFTGRVLRKSIVRTAENSSGSHERATVDAVIIMLGIDGAEKQHIVLRALAFKQPEMAIAVVSDNVRWELDEKGVLTSFAITSAS